jgi:hypothetical protein
MTHEQALDRLVAVTGHEWLRKFFENWSPEAIEAELARWEKANADILAARAARRARLWDNWLSSPFEIEDDEGETGAPEPSTESR